MIDIQLLHPYQMHLRPFLLLTACLLGACEKRDAAPGSAPPDIAATKSSIRDPNGATRTATRRERSADTKAMDALDSLIRGMNDGPLSGEERNKSMLTLHFAIRALNPADFDVVWKKLGGLEDKESRIEAQITAIHYLSARQHLVTAGWKVRELLFPEVPEEERALLLGTLMVVSNPTLPETVDFLREFESVRKREIVTRSFPFFPDNRFDFIPLKEGNYRLNLEESGILLAGLIQTSAGLGVEEASDLLSTVTSLEREGVFARGTREALLLEIAWFQRDVFFQILSPEQVENQFRQEGYDEVIRTMISQNHSSVNPFASDSDIPDTFFTPTGTHNLPPEKIYIALEAWHLKSPSGAEAWFIDNAASLPLSQRDLIRAGFARNTWSEDKVAAQVWMDQISDSKLRARTIDDLPK